MARVTLVRAMPVKAKSSSGWRPETISAIARPEPQPIVQPSVPCPVFKNKFEFIDIENDEAGREVDLRIKYLEYLEMNMFFEILSHKILNRQIFKLVKYAHFTGQIYQIETDLFSYFK